jgi:hypothetical protein
MLGVAVKVKDYHIHRQRNSMRKTNFFSICITILFALLPLQTHAQQKIPPTQEKNLTKNVPAQECTYVTDIYGQIDNAIGILAQQYPQTLFISGLVAGTTGAGLILHAVFSKALQFIVGTGVLLASGLALKKVIDQRKQQEACREKKLNVALSH